MTDKIYDAIVVGGGVMGVSTAYNLQKSGKSCLLIEQYHIGHIHGSSHGDGRIVRAVDPVDIYARMGMLSLGLWKELEQRQNAKLLHLSGILFIGRGEEGFVDIKGVEDVLNGRGYKYDVLSAEESNKRFPQFHVTSEDRIIYSDDGGMVFADKAVSSFYKESVKLGAKIKQHTKIVKIDRSSTIVKVLSEKGETFKAKKIILCAGAWTNELLSRSGLNTLPIKVQNEQVTYFHQKPESSNVDYTIKGNMPAFIIVGQHWVYGMPHVFDGVEGVKIASHIIEGQSKSTLPILDLDIQISQREYTTSLPRLDLTEKCLEQYFPLIEPTPVNIFRCIYQKSPDGSFIVDRHSDDERVIVATGFSGTGFKHAPAIGLILTQLANGEVPIFDISELSMKRFQVKSKL